MIYSLNRINTMKIVVLGPDDYNKTLALKMMRTVVFTIGDMTTHAMYHEHKFLVGGTTNVVLLDITLPNVRKCPNAIFTDVDGAIIFASKECDYSGHVLKHSPKALISFMNLEKITSKDDIPLAAMIHTNLMNLVRDILKTQAKPAVSLAEGWLVYRGSDTTTCNAFDTREEVDAFIAQGNIFQVTYRGATHYGYIDLQGTHHVLASRDDCISILKKDLFHVVPAIIH